PNADPLRWCALEIQAVYFSGKSMGREFAAIAQHEGLAIPFPAAHRRPDYRSSGPKRLMPQLQIKVPHCDGGGRRWLSWWMKPSLQLWEKWTTCGMSRILISHGSSSGMRKLLRGLRCIRKRCA